MGMSNRKCHSFLSHNINWHDEKLPQSPKSIIATNCGYDQENHDRCVGDFGVVGMDEDGVAVCFSSS